MLFQISDCDSGLGWDHWSLMIPGLSFVQKQWHLVAFWGLTLNLDLYVNMWVWMQKWINK